MGRSFLTLVLAVLAFFSPAATAQGDAPQQRIEPWSAEVLDLFRTIPVQDNGRVKPLDTLAGLRMFTLNGKRSLKLESGEKLSPSEWLLDVLFYPEQAKTYPCIRIQNDAILILVGLDTNKKKRAWYSYDELAPARAAISREANRVFDKAGRDETLSLVDKQVRDLEIFLRRYEGLLGMFTPLRVELPTTASAGLVNLFGPEPLTGVMGLIENKTAFFELRQQGLVDAGPDYAATAAVLDTVSASLAETHLSAFLFPPPSEAHAEHLAAMGFTSIDQEEWWNLADVVTIGIQASAPDQLELLAHLDGMVKSVGNEQAFLGHLKALHGKAEALAGVRGEYKHIAKEVTLYKVSPFHMALGLFAMGFLVMMISFLGEKLAVLRFGGWGLSLVALGYLVWGITMRCIIRERPPVVTLYDTILFVTGVIVMVALISEAFNRSRIALLTAALLGTAGMFMAGAYELREVASAGDTMASVVAVLDTNYYLAIHVTTIAMGYAGGLLAGALGALWILGQLVGLGDRFKDGFRSLNRKIYGAVAFCLLFSIFGTVMGGVWANDSWGRFWGWDPKENGALLICLWMLLIVHLRLGGYIKARGLATMAAMGSAVVSFSWWHVNMLEIGLHSYGKIDGIYDKLIVTYLSIIGLAVLSVIDHYIKSGRGAANA